MRLLERRRAGDDPVEVDVLAVVARLLLDDMALQARPARAGSEALRRVGA